MSLGSARKHLAISISSGNNHFQHIHVSQSNMFLIVTNIKLKLLFASIDKFILKCLKMRSKCKKKLFYTRKLNTRTVYIPEAEIRKLNI